MQLGLAKNAISPVTFYHTIEKKFDKRVISTNAPNKSTVSFKLLLILILSI